jgi:Concanavalin A-like lectin/glucanases superfamily
MVPELELICHHTYATWNGFAVDLSDHDSNGVPDSNADVIFLNDGATPGSGAVLLPIPKSRLRVRTSDPAWNRISGLKVEATVRRGPHLTHGQTLVAGHNSFSFFLANNALYATFRCPGKSTLPLQDTDGLNSSMHGIQPTRVPQGKWVTVGFIHDGFDTMELYLDGEMVARRTGLRAAIPSLGPLGLTIGNEPDKDDQYLNGEIDDLKIWRRDPFLMERQFFSRPVDGTVAACWGDFVESLAAALQRNPDCRTAIEATLQEALDRLKRTIVAKGPESRDRFFQVSEKYLALWRAGQLDSAEMKRLFADWCAWLRLSGISIEDDPAVQELLHSDCLKRILAETKPLDCDPQVAALLQFILQGCAGRPPASPAIAD